MVIIAVFLQLFAEELNDIVILVPEVGLVGLLGFYLLHTEKVNFTGLARNSCVSHISHCLFE